MYFLSSYLTGQMRLQTGEEPAVLNEEGFAELGDACVFCGEGLAEHDHHCRGCGGSLEITSLVRLKETLESDGSSEAPAGDLVAPPAAGGDPEIVRAASAGDGKLVRSLLSTDVNVANVSGETALMWAVRNQDRPLVDLLLERGADPNRRTHSDVRSSPLRVGIWARKEDSPGQSALMWAVGQPDASIVGRLLEFHADPNLRDEWRQTPLLWAAWHGNVAAARLLLAAGADPNLSDDLAWTPILTAAASGHTELVELLRTAGADVHQRIHPDFGGQSLLHLVAYSKSEEMLRVCIPDADLNAIDSHLVTPLTAAIGEEEVRLAFRLIEQGADVNARGGRAAATPLWAACNVRNDFHAEMLVPKLLAAGADPNLTGLFEEPPLQRALSRGHRQAVRPLIEAGADLNSTDILGTTCLMKGARSGRTEFVKLLLGRGLDANARRPDGKTVLMFARTPEIIDLLLDSGADVNAQTDRGVTALMLLEDNQLPSVRLLLKRGADPSLQAEGGITALDLARLRNRTQIAALLESHQR